MPEGQAADGLDTLAAAYAVWGQCDRAFATAQQAFELGQDNSRLVPSVPKQLELYQQ